MDLNDTTCLNNLLTLNRAKSVRQEIYDACCKWVEGSNQFQNNHLLVIIYHDTRRPLNLPLSIHDVWIIKACFDENLTSSKV